MAVGEAQGNLSGKELITSTALGVDMMCRLALATTPGKSPIELGWHLTSLFGFMGSAATAARVMRLDEETIVDAIGIGYHQCGGNGQCVKDGALTKRLGPGFAVKGGITAALMAKAGVTGAKNSLKANGDSTGNIWMGITAGKFSRRIWESDSKALMSRSSRIHAAAAFILPLMPDWLWPSEENIRSKDIKEIVLSVTDAHLSVALPAVGREAFPAKPRGCPVQHSLGSGVGDCRKACGIG